ncbi:Uu.00g023180.m01.CDS01 [Anthostomella pinea]|uniref:Leucine carboxyl methyltransferase 1 n=1 Tax=Anthostomella pinea TaxID=933095 RepID=A0AAI8VZZ1_9PEZI|nr:Uu.00g023180.m01.CDS01 [Anthostomella pinea]
MSPPSIQDLLSERLRGSRGGARGRSRGRRGHSSSTPSPSHDATIQGTDTDAAVSRMSAVDIGYLDDPFAQFFVQVPTVGDIVRRLPIINRGTYTRTAALDRLIAAFLSGCEGQERQIISLGAGTDTRCFKLLSQPLQAGLIYHEIDFPAVSNKKRQLVSSIPPLRTIVPNAELTGDTWSNQHLPNGCQYWCHGLDLRDLLKDDVKSLRGVRTDVPTLLISECCLCYLEVPDADKIIEYFVNRIPSLSLVIYEPTNPMDPFGKQMVSNLAARKIRMPTLEQYTDIKKQETRLKDAGFESAKSSTIQKIWEQWVPREEKERVDSLEGLDEVEEWNLLADHYLVGWGWRGGGTGRMGKGSTVILKLSMSLMLASRPISPNCQDTTS